MNPKVDAFLLNTKKWRFKRQKNGVLNANIGVLNAKIYF